MTTTLRALIAVNVAAIVAFAVALYVAPPLAPGLHHSAAAPPAPIVASAATPGVSLE